MSVQTVVSQCGCEIVSQREEAMSREQIVAVVEAQQLLTELDGAQVKHESEWIIDITPKKDRPPTTIADGPFPAHADVTYGSSYQGEIIVWIKGGHVNGLEFAWVSDDPPSRWPRPDEMKVVAD